MALAHDHLHDHDDLVSKAPSDPALRVKALESEDGSTARSPRGSITARDRADKQERSGPNGGPVREIQVIGVPR
jgi:hypothetical protein